jgi:AcrR family transcriptional regulator
MSEEWQPLERAAPIEKSRHYQRARQDRGTETRTRLILAALDVFGRQGFDAASTREIARKADANLAAIVYHFGSKEGLHQAVAEHVVTEIGSRIGPTVARAADALEQDAPGHDAAGLIAPDKTAARALLQQIVEAHLMAMLGADAAGSWARFIVREQMEPSPAFETVFAFMAPIHAVLRRLVGILTDSDPDHDETGLRTFTLMGQVMVFRVAQPMVLRMMARDGLSLDDRRLIARIVTENIDRIVGVASGSRQA